MILSTLFAVAAAATPVEPVLIDDFHRRDGLSALGTRWSATSDRVMGGVSDVTAVRRGGDRPHVHLTGAVREVPGAGSAGFVQVGLDLGDLDASQHRALRLVVRGDGGSYGVHLRTPDVRRPWQSWRASFVAPEDWTEIAIPLGAFEGHRIDGPLDLEHLVRVSLIKVDAVGPADLRVAELALVP